MHRFRTIAVSTATLISLTAAGAAEVSGPEAERLQRVLEAYVGTAPAGEPPFAAVVPDGDGYRLTIDMARAVRALGVAAISFEGAPDQARLTPLDDGTYRIDVANDETMAFRFGATTTASRRIGEKASGIFDPALGFYRHFEETIARHEMDSADPVVKQSDSTREETLTLDGKPGASGAADLAAVLKVLTHTQMLDLDYSHKPAPLTLPPIKVEIGSTREETRLALTSFKTAEFSDLWRFLVKSPTPAQWREQSADLKAKLKALSPIADGLEFVSKAETVTVTTEFGSGSARNFEASTQIATGPNGGITEHLAFGDLNVESVRLQEPVRTLLPTDVDVGTRVTGMDVGAALGLLIDNLDLAKPGLADGFDPKLALSALMPARSLHYEFAASRLSNQLYAIAWQGFADVQSPHTHVEATVSAKGLDDVIKTLGQVKLKGVPEAVIGLYAAKALAKEGPDGGLTWEIRFDEGLGLTVNGQQVGPKKKI